MTNPKSPQTVKEYLKQMNIIHLTMLAGQLMIVGILFFINQDDESISFAIEESTSFDAVSIVGIFVFISAAVISFMIYNKRIQEGIKLSGTLIEKLDHYKKSFIFRAALLEGPNLFMIIIYFFLRSNIIFMGLFGIGIVLFVFIRPSVDRISQDYQLSNTEQNELRNATL